MKACQAIIASIRGTAPIIFSTRFILYASTCKLISAPTFFKVFIWKCVEPIQYCIVPKGGSTVDLRIFIISGCCSSLASTNLQYGFMFPTTDSSILTGRALCLDRATQACRWTITSYHLPLFFPAKTIRCLLSTLIIIRVWFMTINKVTFTEKIFCLFSNSR